MVDDRNERCLFHCSMAQPRHRFKGPKVAYCKRHGDIGAVDVLSKRCFCTNRPGYNVKTAKNPAHCTKDAEGGMVCALNIRRVFM